MKKLTYHQKLILLVCSVWFVAIIGRWLLYRNEWAKTDREIATRFKTTVTNSTIRFILTKDQLAYDSSEYAKDYDSVINELRDRGWPIPLSADTVTLYPLDIRNDYYFVSQGVGGRLDIDTIKNWFPNHSQIKR